MRHSNTFILKKRVELPEIQCTLKEFEHKKSGATVLHVETDDPENVFCLSFQTLPTSSNGIAHILEHTVLCGSKKFPVKDSFFLMNRRSLNTFMNAFTGADFTCYPAATLLEKDFYNLLEVYVDAVFQPNLNPLSFAQEGHRLEFETADDPNSPLVFKGIVFNEMKGALATGPARLNEELSKHLFPGLTYQYNSGGDPKEIPDISYEEFVKFHHTFYHPSRCLFFFYGNIPVEKHLKFLEEKVLKGVKPIEKLNHLPPAKRLKKRQHVEVPYPIAPSEDLKEKCFLSFGWLTTHLQEQLEALALSTLLVALVDNDASPLKRALLDTKKCQQVSGAIDVEVSEIPITLTLRGCNKEDVEELERTLFATLRELSSKPFDKELIQSSLHQIEFQRSEISGDWLPYGLTLFLRAALLKHHGGRPEEALQIHSLFGALREAFEKDPLYFNKLLEKWLIDNKHYVRALAYPDVELSQKEEQQEKERLEKIKKKLSKKAIDEIVKKSHELAQFQEKEDSDEVIDLLPKVTVKDVPQEGIDFSLIKDETPLLDIYRHECFTNDIIYADINFDLPFLPVVDLPYLRLFTTLLTQLGTKGRNYVDLLKDVQASTGGIVAQLAISQQVSDCQKCRPQLFIQGKALQRNGKKLFELLNEYILNPDFFDRERVKEVIMKQYSGIVANMPQQGLYYASTIAIKGHSVPHLVADHLFGVEYYWQLKKWVEKLDETIDELIEKCMLMVPLLMRTKPDLVLACSKDQYKELKKNRFWGFGDWPRCNTFIPFEGDYQLTPARSQGRILSSAVASSVHIVKVPGYNNPASAHLSLASEILDNQTLHKEIREKGGAYGGGSHNKPRGGYFSFYSYRDPSIQKTLKTFSRSVTDLIEEGVDKEHLEEAKLEMIQELDQPVSPGSRAFVAYAWMRTGKTAQIRKAYREELLKTKPRQIEEAVKKYLDPNKVEGITVVAASQELFEKEKWDLPLLTMDES